MEELYFNLFFYLFSFHCDTEHAVEYASNVFPFTRLQNIKQSSRCFTEKQRNSLRGVRLAFPLRDI